MSRNKLRVTSPETTRFNLGFTFRLRWVWTEWCTLLGGKFFLVDVVGSKVGVGGAVCPARTFRVGPRGGAARCCCLLLPFLERELP